MDSGSGRLHIREGKIKSFKQNLEFVETPISPLQLCACVVHLRPSELSTKHRHHWTLIDLHSPTWLHSFRCSSAFRIHVFWQKIPSGNKRCRLSIPCRETNSLSEKTNRFFNWSHQHIVKLRALPVWTRSQKTHHDGPPPRKKTLGNITQLQLEFQHHAFIFTLWAQVAQVPVSTCETPKW